MEKNLIDKTCSFYVSKYHLVTMLLPYIKEKIDEDEDIVIKTMHEENIEENMEKLIGNINLESKYKNIILNINWKSFQVYRYKELEKETEGEVPINIIISGRYDYVEMMNKNIEKWIKINDIKNHIIINNCYNVTELDIDVNSIISKYDKLLNTSGIQYIKNTFDNKNDLEISC